MTQPFVTAGTVPQSSTLTPWIFTITLSDFCGKVPSATYKGWMNDCMSDIMPFAAIVVSNKMIS